MRPKVNRAMAALLKQYAFKAAPSPNTLDFLRLLRAEAGPAHDQKRAVGDPRALPQTTERLK